MKISLFKDFGALNSRPVFDAFEKSINRKGWKTSHHDMHADVAVIWSMLWSGKMLQNKAVFDYYRKNNRPVIILEVGALSRGNYWKVSINNIDNSGYYGPLNIDPSRRNKLNVNLRPWHQKENILVCLQHSLSHQWREMPATELWLKNIITEIRKYSNRKIIIRPHPRQPLKLFNFSNLNNISFHQPKKIGNTYDSYNFDEDLNNAWAVINYNSNPAIISVINGIPVFVGNYSLALPVGNTDLSFIENPSMPDRENWINNLCYSEWSIDEIEKGIPLDQISSMLT